MQQNGNDMEGLRSTLEAEREAIERLVNGEHWYYLHTNGDLIHKRTRPDESDLVRRIWPMDPRNRENAWTIILEAYALGASRLRIAELAQHWNCDAYDLVFFLRSKKATDLLRNGVRMFLTDIAQVHPDAWFGWLASTPDDANPDRSTMPGGSQ